MKRDEAKQLTDQALTELQQALQAGRSETLKRFLDCMGRFPNYSWHNCMLIAFQMPDASFVAGFRRWLEMGRHVRKGEKGLGILAPLAYRKQQEDADPGQEPGTVIRGFKVVHVFDVSQTEGEDLPEFAGIHGDADELLPRLEDLIRQNGIKLRNEKLPTGTQGASLKGEILIAESLPNAERFAVLAHELAHEWMHGAEERRQMDKTVHETEAEAVAYVVCRAFGFDCSTRSSDYIQLYRGDETTLAESLERIQKTATRIIRLIDNPQADAEEGYSHVA
jgi:antirestriction protein ArdC